MRGQWGNYDNFLLIELIQELGTRFTNSISYDMTLHGMIIVGKDYDGICKCLVEYLKNDDVKVNKIEFENGNVIKTIGNSGDSVRGKRAKLFKID